MYKSFEVRCIPVPYNLFRIVRISRYLHMAICLIDFSWWVADSVLESCHESGRLNTSLPFTVFFWILQFLFLQLQHLVLVSRKKGICFLLASVTLVYVLVMDAFVAFNVTNDPFLRLYPGEAVGLFILTTVLLGTSFGLTSV